MSQQNVESDPLFQLLTDALRAGPGTSEWREAVTAIRGAEGRENVDEYKLLVEAREHLESGKDYKSINAGPGFTRRLMENIESDGKKPDKRDGLPIATIVAVLAVVVILGVIGIVVWKIVPHGNGEQPKSTVEQLQQTLFLTEETTANFDGPMPMMPANWRVVGKLPLEASKAGLRVASGASAEPAGGAVVIPQPISPTDAFAAEIKLHPGKPDNDLILEFFVSSDGNFSADKATGESELVWLLRGDGQRVVLVGQGQEPKQMATIPRTGKDSRPAPSKVRILMNKDVAVVEADDQRVWAGSHQLAATGKHVGVRFLKSGETGKNIDPPTVTSVRVLKK